MGDSRAPYPAASSANSFQVADEKDGWKERRKHGRKRSRHYEEEERESRKHREEMERESRKHHEEQERESRKHRKKMKHHSRKRKHFRGPPPWASAHGYHRKRARKLKYRRHGHDRYATVADTVKIATSGLGNCNREIVGGLIGAAAGGLLGSKIGSGDGKIAAVIGGTVLGTLVGGSIGRSMDQVDQNCVGQALERAPNGGAVEWQNPDGREQYRVTPTKTYQESDGRYCREYQTTIVVGGRVEEGYGTACRQSDGSWEKVS